MTLWEREQFEAQNVDSARAEHVRALNSQREAELAEARRREEEWRQKDEEREKQELARRAEALAAREAEAAALVEKGRVEQAERDAEMRLEQKRLAEETQRRNEQLAAKEAAAALKKRDTEDFSYDFEEGMEAKVKAFRQRGGGGDAMLIKIDHAKDELQIEEHRKAMLDLEDVRELLEDNSAEPRFLLYIHKVSHSDGRMQYPLCFLLYMPDQLPVHLKVMYTRPVVDLAATFKVNRHFMLDDPETLTTEWLNTQLGITVR